jgi:hypothetical protein
MPSPPTVDQIRSWASDLAFGYRLVMNTHRGLVAEVIVRAALSTEWRRYCSANWKGWDFEHSTGCRLEVKQSAAQQTWPPPRKQRAPIFYIRKKSGYYEGADWVEKPGRLADVYVFAYHPTLGEHADHRDVFQWQFHIIATDQLPSTNNISLKRISKLSKVVDWNGLGVVVERVRVGVRPVPLRVRF